MKKTFLMLQVALILFGTTAYAARPQAILGPGTGGVNFRVPYHETTNRVLSSDTTYIITGWYFIDSTYSIAIPAGTLLRGDSASGGTLIVSRGAQIFATGTPTRPIIFTSNKPAGTRVPGDWGGVIILGNAPTNKPPTQQIEGGFNTVPNAAAMFGGPDSADNSGILEYVRIEFAGIAFSQDNEINGLTFGGVGAGTTIDHVQVSFANDDDFEFFGGTLQAKYLIGFRSLDDCFDTDFGFSGRLQFLFTKRDPIIFDASASGSSNGEESDNEASEPYTATPRTKVRFSNWTLVGPLSDTANQGTLNSHWGYVALLRRATQTSIYNSIMMGWKNGIDLRDTLTNRAAIDGNLELRHISLQAPRQMVVNTGGDGPIAGFDAVAFFNTAGWGNIGSTARQTTDLGMSPNLWNLDNSIDPVPGPASEPATAGTAYDGRLSGDSFFDSVSYRGAFNPNVPRREQWDWGWSNYDPQNYEPEDESVIANNLTDGWNLVSIPFNPSNLAPLSSTSPSGVNSVDVGSYFPTAASNAFSFNGSYQSSMTMDFGLGYWVKFNGNQTILHRSVQDLIDSFSVNPGWNILGSITRKVPTASIVSSVPGNVQSPFYGYNGSGYVLEDTLFPGQGYWVRVGSAGKLYVDGTSFPPPSKTVAVRDNLDEFNTINIRDSKGRSQSLYLGVDLTANIALSKYELPPVPPAGSLDARFTSQRSAEVLPTTGNRQVSIALQSSAYPLTLSLSGKQAFDVVEMQDGKVIGSGRISSQGTATISNPNVRTIVLKLAATGKVPTKYALSQSYPNPFNPVTHFTVEVPKAAVVEVVIFDILGRKIATLMNGEQEVGYHLMEWNAKDSEGMTVPSGMYFVRMSARDDQFSAVEKIMLLK